MGLLDGKVALVSGVGPNLGRSIALALGDEGASVVVAARTESRIEAVVGELEDRGAKALGVRLDITDPESCRSVLERVADVHDQVDVLVNNAFHTGDFALFADADMASWRHTMEVNLFGTLQLTQAALPALRRAGDGRVVVVNSMSAVRMQPRYGAYAASKAALAAATKMLALELGADGIRVNGIHPGYIWGDDVRTYFEWQAAEKGITFDEQHASVASEAALGYLPDAEETARTVVFLASDLAKPITGQAIGVNGGHWFQGF